MAAKSPHGTYRFLPHPATELRSGFHGPDLPDIRGDRHGLDHLSASPPRDRSHLLQWPCRRRTLVAVSSLLQPRRLGHRHLLHAPGQTRSSRFSPRSATFFWAVDDTLCRKRGLTLYGAGMHYDPLISSRAKSLVSWYYWVVLTLIVAFPAWAPSKVFALPIAMRLDRNRQGLTKGKKESEGKKGQRKPTKPKHDPNHRTRPEFALELIIGGPVVPQRGDHRLRRQRLRRPEHPLSPAAQRAPHQPCPSQGVLYEPASPKKEKP